MTLSRHVPTDPSAEKDAFPSEGQPAIRFYGRRRGKTLSTEQRHLVDALLPSLRLPAQAGSTPLKDFFPEPVRAIWLEIGFGGGEHLVAQAKAHPTIGFIGAEPFLNGVSKLLRHVEKEGVKNIRIYDDDVRPWLETLPDACLDRVFLLFPDPWPKKRHRERRFINPSTLDLLARVMKNGSEMRVASDDPTYIRHTLRVAPSHPFFHWDIRVPNDFLTRWPDAVETRYEAKAHAAKRHPYYFTLRRGMRQA